MAIAPTYAPTLYGGTSGTLNHVVGDTREAIVSATVGASDTYVAGGFSITPATLGLTSIYFLESTPIKGFVTSWDAANSKLKVWQPSSTAGTVIEFSETANTNQNAGALQSGVFLIRAIGK